MTGTNAAATSRAVRPLLERCLVERLAEDEARAVQAEELPGRRFNCTMAPRASTIRVRRSWSRARASSASRVDRGAGA